jgi:hypothetical protein
MGKVDQIKQLGQFTIELHGIDFEVRRLTMGVALEALGANAAGLVGGSRSSVDVKPEKAAEVMQEYLKVCMISPRLGDETDDENDIVSFEDLDKAGLVQELFVALVERSGLGELLAGFQRSSREGTE